LLLQLPGAAAPGYLNAALQGCDFGKANRVVCLGGRVPLLAQNAREMGHPTRIYEKYLNYIGLSLRSGWQECFVAIVSANVEFLLSSAYSHCALLGSSNSVGFSPALA
jgi:hypothetical protein